MGQSVSLTAVYSGAYSYDPDNGVPYPGKGITDYDWDMSDGAYLDGSSIVHEYAEPGEYGVLLRVWDDDPYPYRSFDDEWITVWVVDVDVYAGLTEQYEESPGLYINANWDDDDSPADGWAPNEDPPDATYTGDKNDYQIAGAGDGDFRVFSIHVDPGQAPVTVVVQFQNNIKVWQTFTKEMPGGGTSEVFSGAAFNPQNIPSPLLIEGQLGSQDFRDVSLTATVKYGQNEILSDTVRITVFEVTLTGFFSGDEHGSHECDVRLINFHWSSGTLGKISWDDYDGDGEVGDEDPHCRYFHNCMECQGTVKPSDVTTEAVFTFEREVWSKLWVILPGESEWTLVHADTSWQDDDWDDDPDEDNTPSAENHIYQIDGPGYDRKDQALCTRFAVVNLFRQRVLVKLDGTWYQCSDFCKWHSQLYLKPKDELWLTRDVPAKQKLGGGWINIPANP